MWTQQKHLVLTEISKTSFGGNLQIFHVDLDADLVSCPTHTKNLSGTLIQRSLDNVSFRFLLLDSQYTNGAENE